MKHYHFQPLRHSDIIGICFSLTNTRPNFNIMNKILKKFGLPGYILLDLRACNGFSGNRFFKIHFDGEDLNIKQIKSIKFNELDSELINECHLFYSSVDETYMID